MLAQANLPRAVSQGQLMPAGTPSLLPPALSSPGCSHKHQHSQACRRHSHHHRSELFLERSSDGSGGGAVAGGSELSSPTLSAATAAGSMVRSTLDLAVAAVAAQRELAAGSHGGEPGWLDPRGGHGGGVRQWEARRISAATAAVSESLAASSVQ